MGKKVFVIGVGMTKFEKPGAREWDYPDMGREAGTKALADADVHIPAIGLAKRLEEVYFPDRPDPLVIARGSEALFVLQHLRDEAHRFAITYHRQKRGKRALASPLDDVAGVGPSRKKALLKRFGSVARIARASEDEIASTPGVGPDLATAIHERLTGREPADERAGGRRSA